MFTLIFLPLLTQAQVENPSTEGIKLIGKYFGDSLVLRFVPLRPGLWYQANKGGYQIERQEFTDDIFVNPTPFVKLNEHPIKPFPLEQWKPIVGNPNKPDRNAAIAAQTIHGKPATQPTSIPEQADLLLNNYSMALLAAEFSPKVADASGLRWVDREIKPNTAYRYRVFMLPHEKLTEKVDTAYFIVSTSDIFPTPKPELREVKSYQDRVELIWDKAKNESNFSAYFIERSDDKGLTFKRLNDIPFISMDTKESAGRDYFIYTDSVKVLYKPLMYRIVGITTFGEESLPSEVQQGMGKDLTPPDQPQKVTAKHLGGSVVEISWESTSVPDLKGFMIGRSTRTDIQYQPISTMLSANSRSFIDSSANTVTTNYYIVVAVDTAGNGSASLYAYGLIKDTTPPSIPKGLHGSIDTNGVVTVKWRHSPEPDVKGYKIVSANKINDRYIIASDQLIVDSVWRDTINLHTLTKKIYYKVMAIDMVDNYSEFSEPLELSKPDKVSPVSPQIKEFYVSAEGIRLQWVTSSSSDVAKHRLERRKNTESKWEMITSTSFKGDRLEEYQDKSRLPKTTYLYRVIAIDESGLESLPSELVTLKSGDFSRPEGVKNLKGVYVMDTKKVKLTWDNSGGNREIIIYRAENEGDYSTLNRFAFKETSFEDVSIKSGNTYRYVAKYIYPDGRTSGYSSETSVVTN